MRNLLLIIVLLGTIACTKENDVWTLPENPAVNYVSDDTLWKLSFKSTHHNVDISDLHYYKAGMLQANYNVQVGKTMWYESDSFNITICRNWTGELQAMGMINGKSFVLRQDQQNTYINVCSGVQNCPVTFNLTY